MTSAADGGTNGTVPWRIATERFVPFGSVSPSQLAPGSRSAPDGDRERHHADLGGRLGWLDRGAARTLASAVTTSIPVTLRSLIQPASAARSLGLLTGGNGRDPGQGQEQYYEFRVPSGIHDITANVSFANDPTDPVGAYLSAPTATRSGTGRTRSMARA